MSMNPNQLPQQNIVPQQDNSYQKYLPQTITTTTTPNNQQQKQGSMHRGDWLKLLFSGLTGAMNGASNGVGGALTGGLEGVSKGLLGSLFGGMTNNQDNLGTTTTTNYQYPNQNL